VSGLKLRFLWLVMSIFLAACAAAPLDKLDKNMALQRQAESFYQSGDYLRAAVLYQQLIVIMPSEAEYWFRLGNCNVHLEQPEQAISSYRESLVRDSGMSKAWYNLAMLQAKAVGQTVVTMSQHVDKDDPAYRNLQNRMNAFLVAFDMVAIELAAPAEAAFCPKELVGGWQDCSCD
jgi:tetratricopeptide (TPR) repeat protein